MPANSRWDLIRRLRVKENSIKESKVIHELFKQYTESKIFEVINAGSFCSKTNQMHQILKFILFCSSTQHVSDGLSVHHQESKTIHTAPGVCQTDSADCLLAGTRRNCSSISFPLASS